MGLLPHLARKGAETLRFLQSSAVLSPIYSPIVFELRLAGAEGATIGSGPVTPRSSAPADRSLLGMGGRGGGYTVTADGSIAALAWAPPPPDVSCTPAQPGQIFFQKFGRRLQLIYIRRDAVAVTGHSVASHGRTSERGGGTAAWACLAVRCPPVCLPPPPASQPKFFFATRW
jgi:hypothetical protein